nr:MAG TPA: hypothetical protein [Caudoviricetes sp.]
MAVSEKASIFASSKLRLTHTDLSSFQALSLRDMESLG